MADLCYLSHNSCEVAKAAEVLLGALEDVLWSDAQGLETARHIEWRQL